MTPRAATASIASGFGATGATRSYEQQGAHAFRTYPGAGEICDRHALRRRTQRGERSVNGLGGDDAISGLGGNDCLDGG